MSRSENAVLGQGPVRAGGGAHAAEGDDVREPAPGGTVRFVAGGAV